MTTRFLIDSCLTTHLVRVAREAGYEAMHLRDLRLENKQDWELIPVIRDGGWTFVTRNAHDFRGPRNTPGTSGAYRRLPQHAGLICLNGPVRGMSIRMQEELFRIVLEHISSVDEDARGDDLAGQVVEASIIASNEEVILLRRYDLPKGSWGGDDVTSARSRGKPPQ